MEDEKKKRFNWAEFVAIVFLVLLTAVVSAGATWYVMSEQIKDTASENDAKIASYLTRIAALEAKNKEEATPTTAAATTLTANLIATGTYSLGGTSVTLVSGKATVGEKTYTLDTKNVAYTADKSKAVAVIKETTGTSTVPTNTYVVAVTYKDGKASQVASATVTTGSTVTAVSYGSDGKITITTTSAASSTPVTKTYTISGTTFTEATS